MSINRKNLDILEELAEKKKLPLSYFSEKYQVSERNIRYSIENLNFYLLKSSLHEIFLKKGELEWICSKEELKNFIKNININNYIFSKEERENYILISYLFSDSVKIANIEKYLKVSRPTIKKDLISLNKYLKEFELEFIRKENNILIEGKEKKLRHLKLLKLLEYIEVKDGKIEFIPKIYITEREEIEFIKKYLENIDISQFWEIILDIEKELNVKFDEKFKTLMYLYLIPTMERIKKNNIIIKKDNSEFLRNLSDYKIIRRILTKIIPENLDYEFLHLTEYFISGYYSSDFSENISIVNKFIEEFCKKISQSLNFNFVESEEYKQEILRYLLPAVYRIKNNFFLIKNHEKYSGNNKIYENVKKAVLECNCILKEPFREDEIVFLAKTSEKYIEIKKSEKISLKKLISIINENKNILESEQFIDTLLLTFGDKIEDDR
ncbi:helix-turn-helix domain-containing protein [Fusobacterium perfoetens]|uniref:helix-turn-helix domain-containing protein n=1 Tax=Fusobacterium perfoetens TaxID=852 RepID=UPI0006848E4B|nr:helix-turn-helix domain-containing protein [Fusobacterium perfoetens]